MSSRPKRTILLVEDETSITEPLAEALRSEGFDTQVAGTVAEALELARREPDLVLLDVMLPDGSGFDVCRELRTRSQVPIIMLTARGEEADRVVGLELGADDYVVKPFSPKELVARVRAVLRRANGAVAGAEVLRAVDVEIDLPKMRARVHGQPVDLTPTEFELLTTLVREPGRVFTRGQLLDALRGVTLDTYERAIDAHVKNLRKKIEPEPGRPRYVLTVHGVGYRFADA
jgi:DNA-binding response OmpR family regulator